MTAVGMRRWDVLGRSIYVRAVFTKRGAVVGRLVGIRRREKVGRLFTGFFGGDDVPADGGEDFLVGGFHELPGPDGADFIDVGDFGVAAGEYEVRAAAIGSSYDDLASCGITDTGLEGADGDVGDGRCVWIGEMHVGESDFEDDGFWF